MSTSHADATTTNLTDPQLADELVATVRDWVRKDVVPVASDYEHEDRFPEPLVAQMRAFGLFGSKVPEDFGGLGLDTVTYARLMEELAYGWMSLASTGSSRAFCSGVPWRTSSVARIVCVLRTPASDIQP